MKDIIKFILNQVKEKNGQIRIQFPKKNNPNKNRDSLYGDCPVPIGSPRDTNVEWYPLTKISDCAQFFSDGIESTKDHLLRDEFNEEMLGDKNLDS